MQPIVKNTTKDPARPAHEDADDSILKDTSEGHSKLNKIAGEAAGRGLERQRKDEEGRDTIVQSDPHGTKV